jgi:hypothetical protein
MYSEYLSVCTGRRSNNFTALREKEYFDIKFELRREVPNDLSVKIHERINAG